MELSGVFDGAYPTAEILSSAGGLVENAGDMQLIPEFTKFDEPVAQMCRVYSAARGRVLTFAKHAQTEKKLFALGGRLLGKESDPKVDKDKVYTQEQVDALMKEAVEKAQNEASATIQAAAEPLKVFMSREQATEVLGKEYDADTILKFAKEGIQHREELVQETIEWGIRAQGNDFPADAWKQMLSELGRTIEAIKEFRDGFKKQAEMAIPAGRMSTPATKDKLAKKPIPDEAFEA